MDKIEERAWELLETECGKPLPFDVPTHAALSALRVALITAAQQQEQEQAVVWVSAADIAPFIGAPQMAEFWGTVILASGPGDGRTVPLYLTAPPSTSVEDGPIDANDNAEYIEHCADRLERCGLPVTGGVLRAIAHEHRALAKQAAAAHEPSAAVATIQFALTDPEGMTFLRLWNEGEFDTLRREWPDAPKEVYDGADPLA